MPKDSKGLKQIEVTRIIKGLTSAGLRVSRVVADGEKIFFYTADASDPQNPNPWDGLLE